MTERMTNAGWEPVTDRVEAIKVNALQWVNTEQNGGTLFRRGPQARDCLDSRVASPGHTVLTEVPYVYIPRKPITFKFLNRVEAGNAIPVFDYR